MKITVFTPAYNRGYMIDNLYRSLQGQKYTDFEWVVVDDGSTDDTEEKFAQYIRESNPFPIIYKKVENGGKHRAINIGVEVASGELFYIVDSDDYITDNALEKIIEVEESIPVDKKNEFAGVCGLKGYPNDKNVGDTFDGNNYLDITMLERPKYGITGDKAEVFYTEILRKYPFPSFENEKFITECVVWDKIAFDGYKMRFFNEVVYIGDYLEDGLSAQGLSIFDKNPRGYALYLYQSSLYRKLKGWSKWKRFTDFYFNHRNKFGYQEICKMLHVSPLSFIFIAVVIRIICKIYTQVVIWFRR